MSETNLFTLRIETACLYTTRNKPSTLNGVTAQNKTIITAIDYKEHPSHLQIMAWPVMLLNETASDSLHFTLCPSIISLAQCQLLLWF